jgi:3-deoxy-manno-octulosonate cytidylyltransferase (CMP-KDO synthetase)
MKTRICAIIPARMASTRLPNKPLRHIANKPMIEWVYKRVKSCDRLDDVYVATDHKDIYDCVVNFGGKAIMTSVDCPTGTDRLIEAVSKIDPYDIIVNVQGDEPLIETELITESIETFLSAENCVMGTIATSLVTNEEYKSPNNVKVIINRKNEAMYFSRAMIPFFRDSEETPKNTLLHIGLYVYKTDFLNQYGTLQKSELEDVEKLEQLRVLENGYSISVAKTNKRSFGVDTEEDLIAVEKIINKNHLKI